MCAFDRLRVILSKKCWIALIIIAILLCYSTTALAAVVGGFDSVRSIDMTGVADSSLLIGMGGVSEKESVLELSLPDLWRLPIEEPTTPDYVSPTPAEDFYDESTGVDIPIFYPFFKMASDATGVPIQVFWISGALVTAAVAGVLAMMFLHSLMISGVISGTIIVAACSMGIVPWWVLYVYIFMAVAFIVYQRVVSV